MRQKRGNESGPGGLHRKVENGKLQALLGLFHLRQFQRRGELVDIDKAIKSLSRSVVLVPNRHPKLSRWLRYLCLSHWERYRRLDKLKNLEQTIKYASRSLALIPNDHPDLPDRLDILGGAYNDRFRRLDHINDLETAIEHKTRALALTPDGHPELPSRLMNLGISYSDRFERLGSLSDAEKALECDSRALALTPDDHPDLPDRLDNLGLSYGDRFRRLEEFSDLEKSFECASRALSLTPVGHPKLPTRLGNLGICHWERFRCRDQLDELEKAIEYATRALALTPDGHSDKPDQLGNLAQSYNSRFKRLGELSDLEKAIEYDFRAIALTSVDHPDLPARLGNLAVSYKDRFQHLGELNDLEKAIKYDTRAVALTPIDHPNFADRLAQLAVSYSNRFQRLGEINDLEEAIKYESRAVALTPNDHPDLPARLGNLAVSYSDRFQHLGDPDDHEKVIELESRALALTPDGHRDLPERLGNLGESHRDRLRRLGELKDLGKALEYASRALELTPDGHPKLPTRLSNLGLSHWERFRRLEELDELEKAIECTSRALTLTPEGHQDLPDRLGNLAVAYKDRFQRLCKLDDLEKAIENESRALKLTPDGHPRLLLRHFGLASSLFSYFEHTGDSSRLQHSMDSFRIASQSPTGAPRVKFQCALQWAQSASKHSFLQAYCLEAFQTTIDLLPQFVWLGATTYQRYMDLWMTETLAIDAAMAAILSSDYALALEWLEHARCVVWNQNLMLRSPLDQLQYSHPDLANRLKAVADELYEVSSEPRTFRARSSSSFTPEQVAERHRRLAREYADLLSKAHKLPGFEDFQRPMKANKLVCAARNGPIVVINCHVDRCDALLILPGNSDVNYLHLPDFNEKKAKHARSEMEESLRHKQLRERGTRRPYEPDSEHIDGIEQVLTMLWSDIVKPVLDFLGFMNDTPSTSLPHITWCPTGTLSFLPLHAAGNYEQPKSRIFNYAISSYTPTLNALNGSTRGALQLNRDCQVLAIGQANTPGHNPLPGTVPELAYIKAHIQTKARYSQLIDNEATTAVVLEAMKQHNWVHFACHAHQNVEAPTESGFFLHNGVLDLASINRLPFKNKGLAFLSACQTATGEEQLPDEAIHLASGMLMAGYPSVIATMWSVWDEDAPFVADKVYTQLTKDGGIEDGGAGKALHYAVRVLREKVGEKEFGRWVPYIHIGS